MVRLKGGDPSVFGRLEEELQALAAAGIACEVVPGVTAAIAAAAATQRPLTRRGSGRSVSLTTAMTRSGELHASRSADTEVFYMAGQAARRTGPALLQAGWPADTPVRGVARRLARPAAQRPPCRHIGRGRACCTPAGRRS